MESKLSCCQRKEIFFCLSDPWLFILYWTGHEKRSGSSFWWCWKKRSRVVGKSVQTVSIVHTILLDPIFLNEIEILSPYTFIQCYTFIRYLRVEANCKWLFQEIKKAKKTKIRCWLDLTLKVMYCVTFKTKIDPNVYYFVVGGGP